VEKGGYDECVTDKSCTEGTSSMKSNGSLLEVISIKQEDFKKQGNS
jgi:hypothetical protein